MPNSTPSPEVKAKAKTKKELLAEKMRQQRVGHTAFDAGKTAAIDTEPSLPAQEPVKEEEPEKEVSLESKSVQPKPKSAKENKSTTKTKKTAPEKKETTEAPAETPARVLDRIRTRERIEKKTNAYYLSVENIEKLEKAAEAAGMKPSPFLDDILTAIFSE